MSETLQEALKRTYRQRWATARDNGKTLLSQAERALVDIAVLITHDEHDDDAELLSEVRVAAVTPEKIEQATSHWYGEGLAPATITKRLNCLSAMGIQVNGMRPKKQRKLQWWLRPEDAERLRVWLDELYNGGQGNHQARQVAHFIFWTMRTGFRVEETLRLCRSHFVGLDGLPEDMAVTVPGTKTASAGNITLPLSEEAAELAIAQFEDAPEQPGATMFTLTYEQLVWWWGQCRAHIGAADTHGATLKALRRSAARYLHVDCNMPLDMVRQYLRHEDIATTMGYLRLTGGYGTEEMRRFLK
ncbi:tyrosine-type recombinase/integrase [Aminobacter sp. HY435]|uniref:tyrosine-type recombinase/integrase n=1 Tax=Aminobacter sp. HY435 TaxID=2970917 RepID=UPI0022B98ED1|nr:site-specific integrase [Aminobacter sp. HY435]